MNDNNVLNWLNNETARNQIYHNHKENMAWVATALYLTGTITMGISLDRLTLTCLKIIITITIIVITLVTIKFVNWQFNNRKLAADKVKALILTTLDMIKPTDSKEKDWTTDKDFCLPKNIVSESNLDVHRKWLRDSPIQVVEYASYVTIVLTLIMFGVFIWY